MTVAVEDEHADYDHHRADPAQNGDLVAEYDHGQPDEESSLAGVGHAGQEESGWLALASFGLLRLKAQRSHGKQSSLPMRDRCDLCEQIILG